MNTKEVKAVGLLAVDSRVLTSSSEGQYQNIKNNKELDGDLQASFVHLLLTYQYT